LFICISSVFAQDVKFTKEDIAEIYKNIESDRQRKQEEIVSLDHLPGTVWIINDPKTNPWSHSFSYAYIFLMDNIVIIAQATIIEPPDEFANVLFYQITSILSAVKYNVIEGKIIILSKLSCYLKDTYLYFGDESYGYVKYRLDSTFFSDSAFD
jgi:hypothetical protein